MTEVRKAPILFLCQNLPYPPDAGAHIRSFHTLRLLGQRFEVTALCFYRTSVRAEPDAVRDGIRGLEEYADHVEAFPIPQDGHLLRFAFDHIRSAIGRRAYTRWVYESRAFRRRLRELFQPGVFKLVHLDSLDLVAYAPLLAPIPIVCAHHNVESSLLRRRAELATGWRRHYLRLQSRLVEREERTWCPRMHLNVVVSDVDADRLASNSPEAEVLIMPNGVDTRALVPSPDDDRRGIVFVGGHTWFPNRDGMEYFAEAILPRIRERHPDVEVTWVGRAPEEIRAHYARLGVRMTGYVDDIRPFVHRAACFVVPLRVGGGTRLKILDAWALGKAVVSTTAGCEGLSTANGVNMLIADDPDEFATAVTRVLEDAELRRRLEAGGRSTAVRYYDWKQVAVPMLDRYESIVV